MYTYSLMTRRPIRKTDRQTRVAGSWQFLVS